MTVSKKYIVMNSKCQELYKTLAIMNSELSKKIHTMIPGLTPNDVLEYYNKFDETSECDKIIDMKEYREKHNKHRKRFSQNRFYLHYLDEHKDGRPNISLFSTLYYELELMKNTTNN